MRIKATVKVLFLVSISLAFCLPAPAQEPFSPFGSLSGSGARSPGMLVGSTTVSDSDGARADFRILGIWR